MKKLKLKNTDYVGIEKAFKNWLEKLGYGKEAVRQFPVQIREYLHWLERNGQREISKINQATGGAFMTYFKNRPHERHGGSLSQSHINKEIYALNLLFKYLYLSGELSEKVELRYVKKQALKVREILSKQEVKMLYSLCGTDALGQRDRAMLSVYYGCGLRRSEGLNLKVEELLLERNLLYVSKSKNGWSRYVPMASGVKKDLEKYLMSGRKLLASSESPDNLFLSEKGRSVTGLTLLRRLKDLVSMAGLSEGICLHSLRHSIGTHLENNGMKLEQVSLFLGHRSIDSSQIYTHLNVPKWKTE